MNKYIALKECYIDKIDKINKIEIEKTEDDLYQVQYLVNYTYVFDIQMVLKKCMLESYGDIILEVESMGDGIDEVLDRRLNGSFLIKNMRFSRKWYLGPQLFLDLIPEISDPKVKLELVKIAAENNYLDVIKFAVGLEEANTDSDKDSWLNLEEVMFVAIFFSHKPMVEYLAGISPESLSESNFYTGVRRDNVFAIKLGVERFLHTENNAFISKALILSASYSKISTSKYLANMAELDQPTLNESLNKACQIGSIDKIKFFIEIGADVTCDDNQPLITVVETYFPFSCTSPNLSLIKILIECGADYTARSYCLTGLLRESSQPILSYLLEMGFDLRANNNQVLRIGASLSNPDLIRYIFESNLLSPNDIHTNEDECLFNALTTGSLEVLKLVIEYGADIRARNNLALKLKSLNQKKVDYLNSLIGA